MPTEARGICPSPLTYARQRPITASHSSRYDMLAIISSRYQYGPFLFFVAEVMSNYLTTDGLKKFSLLPEAPFRPEARGICHICHMVNPAVEDGTSLCVEEAASREHRRSIVDTATLRRVCHEERVSIVHEVIVPTNTKFSTCSGNSKLI